ncbi:MAG: hypothetical protein IJN41_03625, partial [Firmicutes bacterium]|nr:hypothetical protein [Bacillota bacterium]
DIEIICERLIKADEVYRLRRLIHRFLDLCAIFQEGGDFNYIGGTLGIPTVMFGASGDHFHSCDEYVCLDSATEAAESLYQFFKDVLV